MTTKFQTSERGGGKLEQLKVDTGEHLSSALAREENQRCTIDGLSVPDNVPEFTGGSKLEGVGTSLQSARRDRSTKRKLKTNTDVRVTTSEGKHRGTNDTGRIGATIPSTDAIQA